jgi:uncharacterized protein YndB with AHSA1/START domain
MPGEPKTTERGVLVREVVHVELTPHEAFRLFTEGIADWWPLEEGYSYGGDRARDVFLEPFAGGRFYERFVDGDELQVGTVTICAPPNRIQFTWRSPDWQADTEVEVRFTAAEAGTLIELEHRGWERLGPAGETLARKWAGGWPRVIQAFAQRAARQ